MIKPYVRSENNSEQVEVEDHGIINLCNLPIRVNEDQPGRFEIDWVSTMVDGEIVYVLSEFGGKSMISFGGRYLGVIREIN